MHTFYICEGCWEEALIFKNSLSPEMSHEEIQKAFGDFMNTTPGTYTKEETFTKFFEALGINPDEANE